MDLTAIALPGLERAQARFDTAAGRFSSACAVSSDGPAGDSVDLSAAAVELLASRSEFAANVKAVKLAGDMERQALDLLG